MEEMHQPQQVGPNMMANVGGVPNHSNNVNRRNRVRLSLHSLMMEKLPISEAAQLEMKSLSNKTPVSILQELLSRRGTTPKYELIQVEGAIHEPIFRYRVTVPDIVDPIVSAMGTGKSKKEAKHAAARAVLDKLCRLNSETPDSPLPNNIPDSENLQELPGYGEEKRITNPIGALQEMCMSRHWPPPKYTMENEEGLPHERQFTIVCSLLKYREVGSGKSKKVAKRHAAHKMWQALHDMNTENSNVEEDEVLQRNANVSARYADLKGSKISTLTTIHSLKVSQFHKSLKSSTGVKLFELQNTCLNDGDVNLVQFLQEIASEQQFEVTYVDIEEKSISGKCQCLVQLSTLPVAVCYGCGVTSKDAQASAAQNALEYLKIMTKNNADSKLLSTSSQIPDKGKTGQKVDHVGNKGRLSKSSVRTVNTGMPNKDGSLSVVTTASSVTGPATRMSASIKKNSGNNDNVKSSEQVSKNSSTVTSSQSSSTFNNVRGVSVSCIAGNVPHENASKSKDYSVKKFPGEIDSKSKNYPLQSDYKESPVTSQDYKARNSTAMNNLSSRYVNQSSVQSLHRENHGTSGGAHHSRPASRNDNTAFAVARKALEQQNSAAKMTPINFPPLRAPQSIVNVRHPFVTEARTKHNEIGGPNSKLKLNVASSLQSGVKDLDHGRQTFHSYGTSQIAGIPNVQNLSNVTANMSPYPRPDSFPQPTVTSMLFPDTSQFPQSPPFSTTQIGQLNQYQTYDPGSFATTPVNVNPVIPQFSAESSIPYPQYDNPPQFVQPNHYPTADIASSQYQYQAAGVGQLQDSPMFIQSLQSPIAVTDQYAAPNYARTVRTELIPRLRRPPRFNK